MKLFTWTIEIRHTHGQAVDGADSAGQAILVCLAAPTDYVVCTSFLLVLLCDRGGGAPVQQQRGSFVGGN
jgi:hypothetical protein